MSRFIDFEFKFRPLRTVYVLILAALVYWVSDSIWPSLITALAVFDIDDQLGKDDG
jgi:hypothetical protein